MRRVWIGLALVLLVVVSTGVGAWAATGMRKNIEVEYKQIQITVDDKVVTVDAEPFLYVEKGRVFVPARPLAEALGGRVGWDAQTNTVKVYTKNYFTVEEQGDYKLWNMAGAGFTMRAPASFVQQNVTTAKLQLALPVPEAGANAVIMAEHYPAGEMGTAVTPREKLDGLTQVMQQTIYPDLQLPNIVEEKGRITASGSATLMGRIPVLVTIRLIEAQGGGDWLLMHLIPTQASEQLSPVMKQILDSFTLK
ncbi:MAG: stalk domain-containing protein [Bacillota bacterium]